MSMTVCDAKLVEEFKAGNTESFEVLVSRYAPKVYSMASRFVLNKEDAEEVLQDVFVTVYRKIKGFEGKSSFSSWLYRVAFNTSLMKLRKRRQFKDVALEDFFPDFDNSIILRNPSCDDTDKIADRRRMAEVIEEAISRLPGDYKAVYILRDIDGLSSREVGKILRLSIPAVKSRLHRSRMMLRRKLLPLYRQYVGSASMSTELQFGLE